MKLDNAIPNEIKTAGKAKNATISKTKLSVFGGLIDEKFRVIPMNIPKRTIFFNKPKIVLKIIKIYDEFLLLYPSIMTVV